jgi:hypothetical protein
VDYQFQLSDQADLRWVLSPNFDKLVSLTAERGQAQHALPCVGLLNPGQRYAWRVRAMDARHLWGAWSAVWSFVPNGPGVPLKVRFEEDGLAWEPNPEGRAAVRYDVYGSNEKGFTASDADYPANVGNQKQAGLFAGKETATFSANRLATVATPRFPTRPAFAFYRVVAIDEKGVKSGASDYASARRPFITTEPPKEAPVGRAYRYEARSIASMGDLRCRTIGAECYNAAFWDAERPRFTLAEGPPWLKLDAAGVLSGTPPDAGDHPVRITVELPGLGTASQTFTLHCAAK